MYTFYLQLYQGWMSHILYIKCIHVLLGKEVPTKYIPVHNMIYLFDIVQIVPSKRISSRVIDVVAIIKLTSYDHFIL